MTRFGYVMVAYFATMATIVTAFVHPSPRLIWNASASVPVGLYRMRPVLAPKVGDLVAVLPPKALAGFLAERHYLPRGVPMLKHVAGVSGQRVCRIGARITVDGKHLGDARKQDHLGRGLPVWTGCRVLTPGDVFLMNPDVPDSFDGRYFGPLPATTITGRLTPLWITQEHDRAARAPKSTH
ncbi:MAG: S26 family signal peptidase [Sphingomonas sp.]|jgi:conjugative transfer signal peptidase TraF|uniref:S26 family signal peptidase n=1 Tax=Sphingomonas sp. TaxID=28214 RepID=UPI003563EB24